MLRQPYRMLLGVVKGKGLFYDGKVDAYFQKIWSEFVGGG
jgi:hypothetical protein